MMKRKRSEAIDRWKLIISAVFAAEAAISKDWKFKLKAAKNLGQEEREKLADEYLEAIAEEIISGAEKQESTKNNAT